MNNTRQARQNKGNRIALGILIIAVSLFCFLCDVRAFGGVGRMVYGFLVGFFGLASYAYSIMGIVIGVCIMFGVRPKMRISRGLFYFGMLLIAIFALHIYTSSAHILGAKYGEYLMNCYDHTNTAGGMLFGLAAFPLMKAVTTVGALVIACAAFFVLGFFAILPSLKRNTVYTASSKADRERYSRPARVKKSIRYVDEPLPAKVEALNAPALTDFSQPSGSGQNLFVVNVEGDPLQNGNKKYKGADGYRPLYPNAMGAYEDELTRANSQPMQGEEIYSPRNLAKGVLFARDDKEMQDNLARFNTASNPNDALNNFGRQSSTVKRNELRQKLGIDTTSNAYREEYLSRYKLRENLTEPESVQPVQPIAEQVIPKEEPAKSDVFDFKAEFQNLKAEQVKRFGEMYVKPEFEATAYSTPDDDSVIEAENVKKEVVKPTRTRSDFDVNPTVQKAESAVEKQVNVGLQGALNRALSGEDEKPVQAPKNQELVSEAYEKSQVEVVHDEPEEEPIVPVAVTVNDAPRKSVRDMDESGYKPQPAKMPRAFEGMTVEQQSFGYEMPDKATFEPKNKYVDNDSTYGGDVPSAPAPRQQKVTGDYMSRSAIQSTTAIAKQSAKDVEDAEMQARIKNIRQALKEAPKMSEFELEAARREEKMRASQDRGIKKTEKLARNLEKIDGSKPHMMQVNMEQAIEQATEQERPRRPYVAPPLNLLNPPVAESDQNEDYESNKAKIVDTLAFFSIQAEVTDILVGPTFTMYKLNVEMPRGRSVNYIMSAEKDLTMKLKAGSVRIIAPIPGEDAVGIEVPNKNRRNVNLSEVIGSVEYNKAKSPATLALGVNLYGKPCFVDVKKLPHALIAGSTGAGKSCCINSIIISLLYKASPDDVRLIMIDPKRVELSMYAGIPHLLMDEIICDTDKAIRALNWAIEEMNRRIKFLAEVGFQNIDDYNESCAKSGMKKVPRIIIIVDEFADLMSTGKKAVEDTVNRIARLARAAGIHLILATQRPSVDVISGTIKNNFPSRMAFKVTSSFDSKTMLDQIGAEKLLGYGDMLFMLSGQPLERMQGAFISNAEIKNVIDFVKANNDSFFDNNIKDAIFKEQEPEKSDAKSGDRNDNDTPPELFKALEIGIQLREENNAPISVSLLQRKLGLGWPKAARIYDMMDERGYLSVDENDPKKKKVNISYDELAELQLAANGEGDEE